MKSDMSNDIFEIKKEVSPQCKHINSAMSYNMERKKEMFSSVHKCIKSDISYDMVKNVDPPKHENIKSDMSYDIFHQPSGTLKMNEDEQRLKTFMGQRKRT